MIPKIIHLVWFGEAAVPTTYKEHISQWRELNPGYKIIVWVSSVKILEELVKELHPSIGVCNAHAHKSEFANYSLMMEQFALNNLWGAVDIFKVDLMVHRGGFYFDLGIKPMRRLDDFSFEADAFCELRKNKDNGTTSGKYHFHASVKGGLLYMLAQKIQYELIQRFKLHDVFLKAFTSSNIVIKYCATMGATGIAVFIAVDCIAAAKSGDLSSIVSSFPVDGIGEPKKPPSLTLEGEVDRVLFKSYASLCQEIYGPLEEWGTLQVDGITSLSPPPTGGAKERGVVTEKLLGLGVFKAPPAAEREAIAVPSDTKVVGGAGFFV